MFRLRAEYLLTLYNFLAHKRQSAGSQEADTELEAATQEDNEIVILRGLKTACDQLALPCTGMAVERLIERSLSGTIRFGDLEAYYKDIQNRLIDEMKMATCFIMPTETARTYYEPVEPFGSLVVARFPSAAYDIEESSKCFAVGRYTACVMHLQRVLEVGLKGYGYLLQIQSLVDDRQPDWGRILDQTGRAIKDRNNKQLATPSWNTTEEKTFCEGIQPFLEGVKIAWRNTSMHADKVYNEETAEDIFGASKRLMRHLAEHIDETGIFTI
jgi:hypothetical protein